MTADVEYGPGIVQKLTAKFTQLSQEVSSTARYSPHTTRKRFPSVDDILSNSSHNRASTNLVTHRYVYVFNGNKKKKCFIQQFSKIKTVTKIDE